MTSRDRDTSWGPIWRIGLDSTISVRAGVTAILVLAGCIAYSEIMIRSTRIELPDWVDGVGVFVLLVVIAPAQIVSFVIALRFLTARIVMHKLIRRRQPFGRLAG